jgi:LDH2 family malate/lactate/ureidoglycolate dehydrogenase
VTTSSAREEKRISVDDLARFVRSALLSVGAPERVAELEATITAEVDLAGVHSHGVQLLPDVIDSIKKKEVNPDPRLVVVAERPASVLYETDRGIGRYVSAVAMDAAIERARRYGVGTVAVRGVAHWGRGHSYACRAARAGMIGLAFTNATANFPAWGTNVPSLGNNPMAIGIPAREEEPVVLDMAMTQAAIRRIMDAAENGKPVPVGWGVDEEGRATTDPRAILDSRRFLPMGGHKGSALAFVIELLTAGLTGGLLCYEQGNAGRPDDFHGSSSKLFVAIEPFGDWLEGQTEALKSHLKSSPSAPEQGPARWPGERGYAVKLDYLERGIPVCQPLLGKLKALSVELSAPLCWR